MYHHWVLQTQLSLFRISFKHPPLFFPVFRHDAIFKQKIRKSDGVHTSQLLSGWLGAQFQLAQTSMTRVFALSARGDLQAAAAATSGRWRKKQPDSYINVWFFFPPSQQLTCGTRADTLAGSGAERLLNNFHAAGFSLCQVWRRYKGAARKWCVCPSK